MMKKRQYKTSFSFLKTRSMNKLFLLIFALLSFGCSGATTTCVVEADIYTTDKSFFVDLTIDTEFPEGLQTNLEMYSQASINCNLTVTDGNKKLDETFSVSRMIQYDRWADEPNG